MIVVENLVKYYGNTLAVDRLSFTVRDGEILGLLGPNGAGKTTVLRSITGIVQRTAGKVVVDGFDLAADEQAVKRRLAFVPETPSPFDMLTVAEQIRFVAMAYNTADGLEHRTDDLLERFDLAAKKNELVLSLSKGMKQKLAIACAFIHDAHNFLFDEPLIGIDPKGVRNLKDLMIEARDSGCAVLISTHMLDTAERLCDRILILREGVKVAEGTLEELYGLPDVDGAESLEDVYLALMEKETAVESAGLPGH